MNEVMDFEETESLNEDIFDCEYTSVDAVINGGHGVYGM